MIEYFVTADWQERTNLSLYPILSYVAHARSTDMVERNYFAHVDPDGIWPNEHVLEAGFRLPSAWSPQSNQVESLASGFTNEVSAMNALSVSLAHLQHMRGLGFWSNHFCFGCGYAEDAESRIYTIITAPIEWKLTSTYLPHTMRG